MTATRPLYPYIVVPTETPAIWGGDALVTRFGKNGDPAQRLGESWECWDDNRIGNGACGGATIGELRARLGRDFMGALDPARAFPVLTKIIDAREALSVQVHPDDAYARRVEHQSNGKTECWYVLAAEPGAELILGWTRDTDRAEYERRVADGTLGEILRRVPVAPGDAFYLPAGTLHAIGAGIQLFETQQTSDLTYRIFDWNRVGADGKPRELHVAKAADVLDYRATFPGAVRQLSFPDPNGAARDYLIADHRFFVERAAFRSAAAFATDGLPVTLTALDAPVRVRAGDVVTALRPFETTVIPAALASFVLEPLSSAGGAALIVRPRPQLQRLRDAAQAVVGDGPAVAAFFDQFRPDARDGEAGP